MITILLNSPVLGNDFDHAIELAITMTDMDIECMVLIMPDVMSELLNRSLDRAKKIKQLELFDIKTCALNLQTCSNVYEFIQVVDKKTFVEYIDKSAKVVTF